MTPEYFKTLRETIGSDTEVADAMETTRSTIHRWENGKREIPGPARVLIRILAERAEAERLAERAQVIKTAKQRERQA